MSVSSSTPPAREHSPPRSSRQQLPCLSIIIVGAILVVVIGLFVMYYFNRAVPLTPSALTATAEMQETPVVIATPAV